MPNIKQHLKRLDAVVDNVFIPVITDGHLCTTDERLLLSLPVKKGGLAIPIFSTMADFEFANSRAATEQLVEHIYNQDGTAPVDTEQLKTTRRRIAIAKEEQSSSLVQQLRENMSSEQLRANDLATMNVVHERRVRPQESWWCARPICNPSQGCTSWCWSRTAPRDADRRSAKQQCQLVRWSSIGFQRSQFLAKGAEGILWCKGVQPIRKKPPEPETRHSL